MYDFDPVETRDMLVTGIHRIARQGGFNKVVIGISGGKDSTVAAALCVRALGKDNVVGVLMPDGKQKDIDDSWAVCKALGITPYKINLHSIHDAFTITMTYSEIPSDYDLEADINVVPRLRMTVLRYLAQHLGARLAGTGNLSEITVGYCTKDGDTSCDFSVLGGLTSVEVVQVGLTMPEIPKELVLKTPADGLSGMSDEEKLGVSYDDIHKYIRHLEGVPQEVTKRIKQMQAASRHKRVPPLIAYEVARSFSWDEF